MNLILFEWKLIVRNKRLRQLFVVSALLLPLMFYIQLADSTLLKECFVIKECFLWAIFTLPANFATLAFSINASFIEKQVIAPLSIFKILQAKYRLYCITSGVLFILFLPSLFLGIKLMQLVAAFLFSVGFAFGGLFYSSLFSYKPFNIKASYFANYQGFDAGNYFFPMLMVIVALGLLSLFYWFFNEIITLTAMSLTGLVFIATNRIWLGKIGKNFEKSKYHRLECFREK
ncbi:hypothetical protein FACS189426_08280 [Bacteroidia bacterium]|nr:hypothetical protein FACS189426_08280 [Bacteroidia bacterium]GHV71054.1 hypothetical protein FACS189420_4670 [Bacteroidia bacterium]